MELKTIPQHIKAVEDRTVTGIFAVMGNVDSYNDRLMPGAFSKTFAERGAKTKFLWQHNFEAPAIAIIKGLREVGVSELPPEVLQAAPDAIGGAEVVREYLDTPRADEVLKGIKAGVPYEMSFGYDALKFSFETPDDAKDEWDKIRILQEVRLWEVSDVLWGANDATLASKAQLPIEFLLKQLEIHIKAGARHSAADIKALNAIHKAALELGATNCKGILEDDTEAEKSRADVITSLTLAGARLRLLQLG
jgi:uncharacterized protein